MSIVNGYDKPRFIIKTSSNAFVENIDLDLTNSDGLIEDYQSEDIFHQKLKDNEIVKRNKGKVRISFTLHYNQRLESAIAIKIQSIKAYEDAGYKIFIAPRLDLPERNFQVVLSKDNYSLGINKGGQFAQSNRLLIMKWISKKLEHQNWIDPNNRQFILEDYILN